MTASSKGSAPEARPNKASTLVVTDALVKYHAVIEPQLPENDSRGGRLFRPADKRRLAQRELEEFFQSAGSGIACFRFPAPIDCQQHRRRIVDQIWLHDSLCILSNPAFQAKVHSMGLASAATLTFSDLFPPTAANFALIRQWARRSFELMQLSPLGPAAAPPLLLISLHSRPQQGMIRQIWVSLLEAPVLKGLIANSPCERGCLDQLLDLPEVALLQVRPNGRILNMSEQLRSWLGLSTDEINRSPQRLQAQLHPDDRGIFDALAHERLNRRTKSGVGRYRLRFSDGAYHRLVHRQVPRLNRLGRVELYDIVVLDREERPI